MRTTIINIGDELLIGQVVNSNAARMAQLLTAAGVEVCGTVVCGDEAQAIADNLRQAVAESDAVLITGGLGPTKDDITKRVLCDFFGSELREDATALENVRQFFARRGQELTATNRAQALVPQCCTVINNDVGTAPCMWFDLEREGTPLPRQRKVVVSMPGVPFEMEHLMTHSVVARLREHFQLGAIVTKNVLLQGIGESHLSDRIEPWESSLAAHIGLAYLPVAGMLKLRLTAHGTDAATLQKEVAEAVRGLYALAADYIVGEDCETLAELVARRFHSSGRTLATAESCTGGSIAAGLTALAGASEYVKGGVVAYSNEVKMCALGVQAETLEHHGAVSEATVREMAEGARRRLGADYAVATSGIAGPTGGTAEKPVGTVWTAIATPTRTLAKCCHFNGPRQQIIERACNEVYAWIVREFEE